MVAILISATVDMKLDLRPENFHASNSFTGILVCEHENF